MLHRLRIAAKRWPGPCLALLLLSFSSQSLADTFVWCLHAGDEVHLASGLAPCDDDAGSVADGSVAGFVAGFVADSSGSGSPSFAAEPAPATAAWHSEVEVATDGASASIAFVLALPCTSSWRFAPRAALDEARLAAAARPAGASPRTGHQRAAISGAVPGDSARLLI